MTGNNEAAQTIAALLKSSPLEALESRILLMHTLGISRMQLITQAERELSAQEIQRVSVLIERRVKGEPIAYIIGSREFYGLPFQVTPDVLIPRPETELLVDLALQHLPPNGRVLDMGTGSGAIAIALAYTRPDLQVTALDVDSAALAVAQYNAVQLGAPVEFICSNWFDKLDGRQFDVIVSNPPYIVSDDHHLASGDLRFEPLHALTDYADGLSAIRMICAGAPHRLAQSGRLFIEHGYDQALEVRNLLSAAGFEQVQSWRDLAEIERVSGGVYL